MAIKLWKFWAGIPEWDLKPAVETTKVVADSVKTIFDLAKTANEKKNDLAGLKPYLEQFSSLLDALNSPLGQLVKDTVPFAPIAVTILQLIFEATKKEPTLEECVALVVQAAYLESVRSLLKPLQNQLRDDLAPDRVSKQIQALGEIELDEKEANQVLVAFHDTRLAREFHPVLVARLQAAGLAEAEATALSDRVNWTVPRYLNQALAEAAEKVKPLAELYRNGGQEVLERYQSLEAYVEREIAPKPDEVIFNDRSLNLTFREIYVRLKAQLLDRDGRKIEDAEPIDLEMWVMQMLMNPDKQQQVLFIQGEAGRGKSVFCRMFSDRVRRELFPSFMPVLIRLRHLKHLENTLTQTLENALETCNFVKGYPNWLTDRKTRFLFLLDGFDELLLEDRASGGLKEFLQQVEGFQRNSHHRFLITGRPLSLQGIERVITQTNNLERVAIQRMDDPIQQQWIDQWGQKVGNEAAISFAQFLQSCPKTVKDDLSREPLLLYLLAKLHYEEALTMQMLEGDELQTKVAIYQSAIDWVLNKQRDDQNERLTGLESDDLRQVLTEAALCVVQAGNECAPLSMLEARLSEDMNELIRQARQETNLKPDRALNNLLTAFYIQPGSRDRAGSVEFTHKSFGEFLCAERLRDAIESWTEPRKKGRGFNVSREQLAWEIYDLLGSPVLSVEIVGYLMAMLKCDPAFRPVELFHRLHDEFYEPWCEGEFIDALPDQNFPQRKMRELREQLPNQEKPLGIRQVDVYAGLNVMILLLELHRYAQAREELRGTSVFYPNGKFTEGENMNRLKKIISYSDCVSISAFSNIIGRFFRSTKFVSCNLHSVDFVKVDLNGAEFEDCNLHHADFVQADLNGAKFRNCNLHHADFVQADLNEAEFENCNLHHADFVQADLNGARFVNSNMHNSDFTQAKIYDATFDGVKLQGADFDSVDFTGVTLNDIVYNQFTRWGIFVTLNSANQIPQSLKNEFNDVDQETDTEFE